MKRLSVKPPAAGARRSRTDSDRLEFYVREVAGENEDAEIEDRREDRVLLSTVTGESGEIPRPHPIWFWELDCSDAEYDTFREAIDARMDEREGALPAKPDKGERAI